MRKDFVDISVFQMKNNTSRAKERKQDCELRDSDGISARLTFQFFK